MANANETSPAEKPEYLGRLPFRSVQVDDPEYNLDASVWTCSRNVCECEGQCACDTINGIYYGSAEDEVTKFCTRHFYEMHSGPNAAYRLVDLARVSKADVEELVREADDAFWQVIARRFPQAKFGDLSPERTIALAIAAEEAVNEWITNNVNPQHEDEQTA